MIWCILSPDQARLMQALAEKVTGSIIVPLIRAGDRAALHQTEERGVSAALQRRDSAHTREGGLEAALLIALRFLSGMALLHHPAATRYQHCTSS